MAHIERDPYGVPTNILAPYTYEEAIDTSSHAIGDAQAELIRLQERGYDLDQKFTLLGFTVKALTEKTIAEAVVRIDDNVVIARAEGNSQAHALTKAMKTSLSPKYPEVAQIELACEHVDVRETAGSQTEARLTFKNSQGKWNSMVVRNKRKDAVQEAVSDAFAYALVKERKP